MKLTRKSLFRLALAGAALMAWGASQAQVYPDKPVKVVVGFAPGGTNDILARLFATKLQERLKQPFVVDNKAGAASMIAAEYSAKAAPDGYTLFVASSGALTINPAIYSKISYDPARDFVPVALLGSYPLVVTVNAASPIKTLKDLIAAGKQAPNGQLDHATGSSTFQLASELLARSIGITLNQVPYKGTGPVAAALMGGEVPFSVADIASVLPLIKAGKLRGVAVTTAQRSSSLPDIPTVAEAGFPGYDVAIWTGLVVPKGTPKDVVERVKSSLKDILADKDTRDRIHSLGMEPGNADSAEFGRLIGTDLARWTQLAKAANIKAD